MQNRQPLSKWGCHHSNGVRFSPTGQATDDAPRSWKEIPGPKPKPRGRGGTEQQIEEPSVVWLSLCDSLLFVSVGPSHSTPFAFLPLSVAHLRDIEPSQTLLSIDGGTNGGTPLQLVFLLPDGRWQRYSTSKLSIQYQDQKTMEEWATRLTVVCSSNCSSGGGSNSSGGGGGNGGGSSPTVDC